jgi:hypothetical protein
VSRLPISRFVQPGDDAAPDFDLVISGKSAGRSSPLFEAVRPLVAGVTYEEDETMASMFELTVINQADTGPNKPADWKAVIDSKVFAEGNSIDLFMGYGGVRQFIGRTDIVRWLPKFPDAGVATLTVKGYDGRHRMIHGNQFRVKDRGKARKRKTHYSGLPDEGIVRKIAEKYGYGVDVDTTEVAKRATTVSRTVKVQDPESIFGLVDAKRQTTVLQSVFPTRVQPADMSDWKFLQKLAAINRFDLWVDFDRQKKRYRVNFKRRADIGSPEYLFTYNGRDGSLISAEPDFAIQEQPTDVDILFYDTRLRRVQRTTISDLNPAENVNLRSASAGNFTAKKTLTKAARVRFSAFGQTIEALANRPFRSKKDAETFVKNWLRERERDFLILKGGVVGIESLRPRQVHQFEGMGQRLDGIYRLTQVKHVMQPGALYECEFVAHKVLSQDVARRKATTKAQSRKTKQQA